MERPPRPVPDARPAAPICGRQGELDALAALAQPDGPAVVYLQGLPGIGKTTLLRALEQRISAVRGGMPFALLDCRVIEPTEAGFGEALTSAGVDPASSGGAVIALDHYDHLGLLDSWLRQRFRHRFPSARLLLASRRPPVAAWSALGAALRLMRLGALPADEARWLLEAAGIQGDGARAVLRITRGHPLGLALATSLARELDGAELEDLALPDLVHRLTRFFLEEIEQPELRRALEAAAVLRRVTAPILEAVLPGCDGAVLYDRLASLPLTEVCRDGLGLHPTVHQPVAERLRAADPARFVEYRRRAWAALEGQAARVGARELWRHTADVIYLCDDPIIREAFFPSAEQRLTVEEAAATDHEAVLEIANAHDGAGGRELMRHWLSAAPQAFFVVRDGGGAVQGFSLLFDPGALDPAALAADPLAQAWWRDLPPELRGADDRVLFLRRWLGRDDGELPSPVQAAWWLDVKRAYLERRPRLRRVYLAVGDLAPYASAAQKLGFVPFSGGPELPLASAMLDFGPGSVDAWLGRLVRHELGLGEALALEEQAHELRLDGVAVPLTPRELAVMKLFLEVPGEVLSREQLLDGAWQGGEAVGSNVVDVLIRGLRKKLGAQAERLETVRGAGYRLRA